MFSQTVIDQLGYYVYYLGDPRNGRVFYVGKGVGNRLLQHLEGAEETDAQTEKLDLIRDIQSAGCPVSHYILRHGLTEQVAFEVEAAMIDFLGGGQLVQRARRSLLQRLRPQEGRGDSRDVRSR